MKIILYHLPKFHCKATTSLAIKTQSHGVTPWQFRKNSWLAGFSSTDFKGVVVVGKRYRVSLEEAEIEQFGLTDHEIT